MTGRTVIASLCTCLTLLGYAASGHAFSSVPDYAVLFEGNGGKTLSITNVTIKGNVGVGGSGKLTDSGPSTINGRIDFAAANTGQFSNNNGSNVITGGVNFNVSAVTTALNSVNLLSQTLGAESGTTLAISVGNGGTQTIDITNGILHGNDYVFTVTSMQFVNGATLNIIGDGVHDIVFNLAFSNPQFGGSIVLGGGLAEDDVLWNAFGGNSSRLTGGPTLSLNNNSAAVSLKGIFLDPNGTMSAVHTTLDGRIFGGDTHDMQIVSGDVIDAPQVPEPSTLVVLGLGLCGLVLAANRRAARA